MHSLRRHCPQIRFSTREEKTTEITDTPANNTHSSFSPILKGDSKTRVDQDGVKDPKAKGLQTLRSKEGKANRNQNQPPLQSY